MCGIRMSRIVFVSGCWFLSSIVIYTTNAQIPHKENNDHRFEISKKSKKELLEYFESVIKDSLVIVGQHSGDGFNTPEFFEKYFQSLHKETNRVPLLLGIEYGWHAKNDLKVINSYAINHAEKGGLVTVTWHVDDPFIDGYTPRRDPVKDKVDVKKLLRNAPDSEAKLNYRKELMSVGNALNELKQQGIIVLWRPFHEMNGSWYWWGADDQLNPSNRTDYIALWKDMYETFTQELNLDNLIWVYGPNASVQGYTQPVDYYYPGDHYVDIVGVDIYSKEPEFKDYTTLAKLNKLVVVSEIGPSKEGYGKYDEMEIIEKLRGKAAWFLQWHSWKNADVAIIDNLRFKEMMNSPFAITLGY